MAKKGISLAWIGFLQALGIILYCAFVALFLWNGPHIFGRMPVYTGLFLFLILFSTSVFICALIVGYIPFQLWQEKELQKALKILIHTAVWLFVFSTVAISIISVVNKPIMPPQPTIIKTR